MGMLLFLNALQTEQVFNGPFTVLYCTGVIPWNSPHLPCCFDTRTLLKCHLNVSGTRWNSRPVSQPWARQRGYRTKSIGVFRERRVTHLGVPWNARPVAPKTKPERPGDNARSLCSPRPAPVKLLTWMGTDEKRMNAQRPTSTSGVHSQQTSW